jgi:hypothetical protein
MGRTKLNQTKYHAARRAKYVVRLPVSSISFILHNGRGWVGWCPLNQLWCAAVWGCGYTMVPKLRQALDHIKWHSADKRERFVPDAWPRVADVRHISDLLYMVGESTTFFTGQTMRFDPHTKPHIRPMR